MIRITIQKNSLVPQFTNTYQLDIWEKSIPWRKGNPRNARASPIPIVIVSKEGKKPFILESDTKTNRLIVEFVLYHKTFSSSFHRSTYFGAHVLFLGFPLLEGILFPQISNWYVFMNCGILTYQRIFLNTSNFYHFRILLLSFGAQHVLYLAGCCSMVLYLALDYRPHLRD